MAQDQVIAPGRRLAVDAVDDLSVGAADSESDRLHQQLARRRARLLDLAERGAFRIAGHNGDGVHAREYPGCAPVPQRPWIGEPGSYRPERGCYSSDGRSSGWLSTCGRAGQGIFAGIVLDTAGSPVVHASLSTEVGEIHERACCPMTQAVSSCRAVGEPARCRRADDRPRASLSESCRWAGTSSRATTRARKGKRRRPPRASVLSRTLAVERREVDPLRRRRVAPRCRDGCEPPARTLGFSTRACGARRVDRWSYEQAATGRREAIRPRWCVAMAIVLPNHAVHGTVSTYGACKHIAVAPPRTC